MLPVEKLTALFVCPDVVPCGVAKRHPITSAVPEVVHWRSYLPEEPAVPLALKTVSRISMVSPPVTLIPEVPLLKICRLDSVILVPLDRKSTRLNSSHQI